MNQPFNFVNSSINFGRSVSGSKFRAYSGNGTMQYFGNVSWSGLGGGYYVDDFNSYQDASTITVNYQYQQFNSKGSEYTIVTNLPEVVCSTVRLLAYFMTHIH
jgi:hypothetical protein